MQKSESGVGYYRGSVLVSAVLLFVTVMVGVVLASTRVKAADNATIDISVTVLSSCTMSASGTRTYSTSINPGIYSQGIGNSPATVFCNDNAGFAVYAIGFTGDTYGNNKLIGTTDNTHEIVTGTATGPVNNVDTSNWAMKITTDANATYPLTINSDTNGSFGSYHIVPTTYTKIAYRTAATDVGTGATGATFNTNYAVYVSNTQPADTYVGKVKYTLVHPNNADAPTIPPIEQAYALAGKTKHNGYYVLQDMTSAICASVNATGDTTVTDLIDIRDNQVYKVAKLADNNCWMLDNLALDPTSSTVAANINSTNTNATSTSLNCLLNANANCSSPYTTVNISQSTNWGTGAAAYTTALINNLYKDDVPTITYGSGSNKVGIYYNYCAASAGSYCYTDDTGMDIANTLIDSPEDLCPKNWRMPTSGNVGEYSALYDAYSGAIGGQDVASLNALSTPLSGGFSDSSQSGYGTSGSFWSSTYDPEAPFFGTMRELSVDSNMFYNSYTERSFGSSIRCMVES